MITGYMAWCIVQDNKSPARSFASRGFDPTVGTAGYVNQIEDVVRSQRDQMAASGFQDGDENEEYPSVEYLNARIRGARNKKQLYAADQKRR